MKGSMFIPTLIFLFSSLSFAQNGHPSQEKLEEIVSINSGTAHTEGVNKVQNIVSSWFSELGFKVNLVSNPQGEKISGKILVAELPGESSKFITFSAHADTVFEPSSPFQKIHKVDSQKCPPRLAKKC